MLPLSLRRSIHALFKARCTGCGAAFQSEIPSSPGYIHPDLINRLEIVEKPRGPVPVLLPDTSHSIPSKQLSRLEEERLRKRFGITSPIQIHADLPQKNIIEVKEKRKHEFVCERCHCLTHAGRIVDSSPCSWLTQEDTRLLSNHLTPKSLLVQIVDLIDWPHSFHEVYSKLPHGHRLPTLLVGNKIDLLPGHGSSTIRSVTEALRSAASDLNLVDVLLVSAKTGFNIDTLKRTISQYVAQSKEHVLLAGRTNVGKSMLYNAFPKPIKSHHEPPKSTVSAVHGTTVGILRKRLSSLSENKVFKNFWLFDIPGLPYTPAITKLFVKEELDQLIIKTKLDPVTHTLSQGETGIIGGFCRIDVHEQAQDTKIDVELFMNKSLPYFRKSHHSRADEAIDTLQGIRTNPPPSLCPPVFQSPDDPRKQLFTLKPAVTFALDKSPVEVVFSDNIGWIRFQSDIPASITISLPTGLTACVRPFNFKN